MAYLSLYRKYRSQTFGDLVGQDHVVRTLQNALKTSRMAHAYLFTGPRGTGKTSSARLLAKALNCENGPAAEPCNTCYSCQSIQEGSSIDVVEIDAASESSVEDVREKIVQFAEYAPAMSRFKIFIIDEVHDLSNKAFDALLKTIEEPPAHLVFILATTEFTKVPPTIRSRCQKFEFHRGSIRDLVTRLRTVCERESIQADDAALDALARMADGGFRDALTLLEHATLTAEDGITVQQVYDVLGMITDDSVDALLFGIAEGKTDQTIRTLYDLVRQGRTPQAIVEAMLMRLAELTRAIFGIEEGDDGAERASTHETAVRLGKESMIRIRGEIAGLHRHMKDITLPRLWLESELIRLCQPVAVPAVRETGERTAASASAKAAPTKPAAKAESEPRPKAAESRPNQAIVETAAEPQADLESEIIDLDPTNQLWRSAVQHLQKQWESAGRKLGSTTATAIDDSRWQVAFSRESDFDTVVQGKHAAMAQQRIRDAVQAVVGRPIALDFVVQKTQPVVVESSAVELPVRNKELHRLAEQVFGQGEEPAGEA